MVAAAAIAIIYNESPTHRFLYAMLGNLIYPWKKLIHANSHDYHYHDCVLDVGDDDARMWSLREDDMNMLAIIVSALCVDSNSCLTWFSKLEIAAWDSLDDTSNAMGLQSQCDNTNPN